MRSLFKILLFTFCICFFSQCTSKSNSEKELKIAIEKFNIAFQQGDIATLENMITDTYSHTNSTSKVIGKETWLNYLKKRSKDIEAGKIKVLKYHMEELKVHMLQNAAIVTAKIQVKTQKKDSIFENIYRVTNIWGFKDGKWKRAGFHDGKIQ